MPRSTEHAFNTDATGVFNRVKTDEAVTSNAISSMLCALLLVDSSLR